MQQLQAEKCVILWSCFILPGLRLQLKP